ncbi:MAG: YCF48-related protein, partial [Pyrinomonadaceae bacterium]
MSQSALINITLRRARRLFLSAALVACASVAWAQGPNRGWLWQNPLPQGNAIYAVRFASDKLTGWAVGADGVILHTTNGGYGWEEQKSQTPVPLYGLYVKDKRVAVAVGARGVALVTTDGGGKWIARETGVKDHLYGIAFAPDALRGWAVGSYGRIIATNDGGRTWKPQASGVKAHLFAVAFADAKTGVAVGDGGALIVT